ncbi:MAG: TIGR02530 family flagellar biosynthesis protein [Bdellovibrionia bacterium]
MGAGSILYPNVTSLPGQSGVGQTDRQPRKSDADNGEFGRLYNDALSPKSPTTPKGAEGQPVGLSTDLSQVKAPLKFSAHASQRLQERKISLDQTTMTKVNDAIDKAEAKGIEDTLVLTKDAALIVNVKNRTVITAMDRNALVGNVFTNIDGAVVV